MTGAVVRFPLRRTGSILIMRERGGDAWLVLHDEHGWLHSDRRAALQDAHWLAWNLGAIPVRELTA
jgi:hypothetical protein